MVQIKNLKQKPTKSSSVRIAYIEASWHYEIVSEAGKAFTRDLAKAGIPQSRVDFFKVPGSLEIPLQAQLLAKTGRYDMIVACGLVVNGGIYRHDFVAATVIDAMMKVQLETEVPILSVVLTPLNFHEHDEHQKYFREHFKVKGAEAASACLKTLANIQMLRAA